jgi:hypothetical protein
MIVVNAVQAGATTVSALADVLDCSPRRAQDRIDAAIADGVTLDLNSAGEYVFELPKAEVVPVRDVPHSHGITKIATFSDSHIGSAYCREDDLAYFVEYQAYANGYTDILIPGDLCDGELNHRGFQYEVKDHGFDAQAERVLKVLPKLPGLRYHFCMGNHEVNSWWKGIGMRPDLALERFAHSKGRTDFNACGSMTQHMESAFLLLNPGDPETEIKVELSHTYDRKAYAISYPLQKHVEAYQPGSKPHLLLKGHLHCLTWHDIRNVVCVQTASFKDQGSWERSKNMQPTIAGILLDLKKNGLRFDVDFRPRMVRTPPRVWEPLDVL